MRGFITEGDTYVAQLRGGEQLALANIISMCIHMLAQRAADVSHAVTQPQEDENFPPMAHADLPVPEDPALLRLFPQAMPEEADLSTEFRRLTEPEIRKVKGHALLTLAQVILEAAGPEAAQESDPHVDVVVTAEQATDVARALTDVRLVLAERLGIHAEEDSDELLAKFTSHIEDGERPVASQQDFWAVVYVIAGFLQETLVDEMLNGLNPAQR